MAFRQGIYSIGMALVQVETLSNGLTVAIEEQPWNPGVAFQLLIPAGATTDPAGLEGATNLLEGWLWKGAGGRDARAFAEALDDLGVRRSSGAGLEASYFAASFLSDHLEKVLTLYADLLLRPQFPDDALDPVRQMALQELASLEDEPPRKMFTALRRAVFESSHGRNPTGTAQGLKAATPEDLRKDYQRRFTPQGAILALVGGVAVTEGLEAAHRAFASWQGNAAELPQARLSQPHSIHLEQKSAQVQIGLVYPDVGIEHPEYYASRLSTQVLSGGMGSRLFTEVREKRGLVYSVYASPGGVKGYSYLGAYAGTTPENAPATLQVLAAEIERLQEGVTQEELDRAKIGLRTALVMQQESARSRAGSIANDLFLRGRVRTLEEIESQIMAVDLGRLNRFVAENPYTRPWSATLGPAKLEVLA